MAYDVLIKNGRVVDGSGMPSFHGDVAIKDGKIVEIGKLSGAAQQTVDVGGQAHLHGRHFASVAGQGLRGGCVGWRAWVGERWGRGDFGHAGHGGREGLLACAALELVACSWGLGHVWGGWKD